MIESILIVVAIVLLIGLCSSPVKQIHHDSRNGSFYEISNRKD